MTVNNAPRHFIYYGSRSVGFVKNLSSVEGGYKVRDFEQVVQKMRKEKHEEEKRQSIWKLYLITAGRSNLLTMSLRKIQPYEKEKECKA